MKKLLTLFLFFVASHLLFAQGKIQFSKISHNFGQIKEDGGVVEVTFDLKNTGNQAITLTSVKASCGCTTPNWSQEPIQPGQSGFVKAAYDPMYRPGKFNKTITVESNGEPASMILTIEGDVIPRVKGIKDFYPIEAGNLRMKNNNVYFQSVLHDASAKQSTSFYNQGDKLITLKLNESVLPKHIQIKLSKNIIQPKDSVEMEVSFDAVKANDWGFVNTSFVLKTDDVNQPDKQFFINANIRENFGKITAESKLPMIKFDKNKHDFGKVNQNTVNNASFVITNEGNAPLFIRKTSASCGCTVSQPKKKQLAPGESTTIDVTFASGTKQGKSTTNITVISNDPANQQTTLQIEADVLVPGTKTEGK